ncbi:hypothetical protein EDC44_10660 [Cricetibacter osteomyelitidis]|uniref:Uncharacterized protein n=1 Tax=Cricetibacter osteomyelitidis TaxID=1521931 RepID=A0A4R2T3H4_9PAST|nr:hypothetical protein [Cricetibacter osteomyelitidis]TCP96001.1 hypothetical protein EDC44_10660 [Cricetibacter osteomyelitidis]
MAQHYPILYSELQEDKEIVLFIKQQFSKGLAGLDRSIFKELGNEYSFVIPNARVFKYIKWEDNILNLYEIHFDSEKRSIIDIFLVL